MLRECPCKVWQEKVTPILELKAGMYSSDQSGIPMYFGVKIDYCPFCGKLLEDAED